MQNAIDFHKDIEYSPSDMIRIFQHAFDSSQHKFLTKGGVRQSSYYETPTAIILPPSADKEGFTVESIQETLERVLSQLTRAQRQKQLIFPITEVLSSISFLQESLFSGLIPRNHWVTLHYDPLTKTAIIIDSRPDFIFPFSYKTDTIFLMLETQLKSHSLTVEKKDTLYQGVQHDNIHCGAWTATNIISLARGATIEDQITNLSPEDLAGIIEHNYTLACKTTLKGSIYRPLKSRSTSPSSSRTPFPNEGSIDSEPSVGCPLSSQSNNSAAEELHPNPAIDIPRGSPFPLPSENSNASESESNTALVTQRTPLAPPVLYSYRMGSSLFRFRSPSSFLAFGISALRQQPFISNRAGYPIPRYPIYRFISATRVHRHAITDGVHRIERNQGDLTLRYNSEQPGTSHHLVQEGVIQTPLSSQLSLTEQSEEALNSYLSSKQFNDTSAPYFSPSFKLRCLQGLFIAGLTLVALTILVSPLAASTVGIVMGSNLSTGVLATTATLSAISLTTSIGLFAKQTIENQAALNPILSV